MICDSCIGSSFIVPAGAERLSMPPSAGRVVAMASSRFAYGRKISAIGMSG